MILLFRGVHTLFTIIEASLKSISPIRYEKRQVIQILWFSRFEGVQYK